MRSEEGIRGRRKYKIRYGMVLLDSNGDVFWKQEGLQFGRSQIKSQLDSMIEEDDS